MTCRSDRRRTTRADARGQGGFSLLETIVAFTILTLMFMAANATFGRGLQGLSAGQERLRMTILAESILAQYPYGLVSDSGTRGALSWTVTSVPYGQDLDADGKGATALPGALPRLSFVTVSVMNRDRPAHRAVEISTLMAAEHGP